MSKQVKAAKNNHLCKIKLLLIPQCTCCRDKAVLCLVVLYLGIVNLRPEGIS